jgi:hypothetical protein
MALDENESTIVPELIYNCIILKHIVGVIVFKKRRRDY